MKGLRPSHGTEQAQRPLTCPSLGVTSGWVYGVSRNRTHPPTHE